MLNIWSLLFCTEQVKKLKDEKTELIAGIDEVTREAQSENEDIFEQLKEMKTCKEALLNRVTELENMVQCKDQKTDNETQELRAVEGRSKQ